jgi:hypothetical protein
MDRAGARGSIPKGESPDRENRTPGSGETKAEFCIILQKEIRMEPETKIEEIQIKEGDTFIQGNPGYVQRVYRIGPVHPTVDLIPCTEVRLINASPLQKINNNYYTYFSVDGIKEWILQNGMGEE